MQRNYNQPNYQEPNQPPQQEHPQPPPQPRYKFRWQFYIGLVLTGLLIWFASKINIALIVSGIKSSLGLFFSDRLAFLACFGIFCITALAIIKVLRK